MSTYDSQLFSIVTKKREKFLLFTLTYSLCLYVTLVYIRDIEAPSLELKMLFFPHYQKDIYFDICTEKHAKGNRKMSTDCQSKCSWNRLHSVVGDFNQMMFKIN